MNPVAQPIAVLPLSFGSGRNVAFAAALLAAAGLSGLATPAQAQITPVPRGGDFIAHRVVNGDTLEQLAAQYLGDRNQWQQLQSHNRVPDPYRLRPGSVLEIPTRLLRAAAATVEYVQGDVRASRSLSRSGDAPAALGTAPAAQAVQKGQTLEEGDSLKLAPDAFVAVRLADGSMVRVQAQSDVQLRQLRRKGRAGSLQSVLDLREGSLEASVPKEAGQRRFEVRTLTASTSVRGTQFLVQTETDGRTAAAVDEGTVAVHTGAATAQHNPTAQALLKPGYGVAVAANGRLASASPMLGAPDIAAWPAVAEDANWISLPLPAQAGAVSYQVLLARDEKLSEVVRNARFSRSPMRLTGVEDGNYVVSIRGIDAHGIPGKASLHALRVKTQPVPPLYETPAAGGSLGAGQGNLQCTKVAQVSSYRIQVAAVNGNSADFNQPAVDAQGLSDCLLPADALAKLPLGNYQWRAASVRTLASGQADQGPFGAAQAFRLAAVPAQLTAEAMQLGDNPGQGSRTIRWPGEEGQRYHLMVAGDEAFNAPLVDTWITESQWNTQELPAGAYYLRIQVEDASGLRSNFSAARLFRTGSWVTDGGGQMLLSGTGERVQRD